VAPPDRRNQVQVEQDRRPMRVGHPVVGSERGERGTALAVSGEQVS
jgi:hypothetical protein